MQESNQQDRLMGSGQQLGAVILIAGQGNGTEEVVRCPQSLHHSADDSPPDTVSHGEA